MTMEKTRADLKTSVLDIVKFDPFSFFIVGIKPAKDGENTEAYIATCMSNSTFFDMMQGFLESSEQNGNLMKSFATATVMEKLLEDLKDGKKEVESHE